MIIKKILHLSFLLPVRSTVFRLGYFVFFCFYFNSLNAQELLEQPVRLSFSQQSIKYILEDIQAEYNIYFSYGELDLSTHISIEHDGTLSDGLVKIFKKDRIQFELIGRHIVLKYAQIKGRKVRGRVVDADSKMPLIGASVLVVGSNPLLGVSTDEEGYFEFGALNIGRYNFYVQYLGYEPKNINQVLSVAGKEVFLSLELQESAVSFSEIVVVDHLEHAAPINDMAGTSARSFSVEETQRFAASISDPARMAQSFAGVTSGGDDLSNEIIIRGNSSRGLLWKLEGVEVPNPNHFGGMGNGGGAVSMLSASTLTNSDFYTGAFPAEFGNALSGVFDLKMRNGNAAKREYSIAVGNLGMEASAEGPFKKGNKASYLMNFRYSTIDLIRGFLPSIGDELPDYRDVSFKLYLPTKSKGQFSVFGLGGKNFNSSPSIRDSTEWETINDRIDMVEREKVGVLGINHRYLLSDKSYIKSAVAMTAYSFYDRTDFLLAADNYPDTLIDESDFNNYEFNAYLSFYQKINTQHKIRAGMSLSHKTFSYDYLTINEDFMYELFFKNKGQTQFAQLYGQWQSRFREDWELNAGINFSYLFLNQTYHLDPRIALKWQQNSRQRWSFSLGLHSKPEHISTYFIERIEDNGLLSSPNKNLALSKAAHLVLGYQMKLGQHIRFLVEGYYQYLYDIPVSENPENGYSVLNSEDVFDIIFDNDRGTSNLVSEGTGENIGLDFTLERPFENGYYFLLTSSVFDSKYTTANKAKYPTITANNFALNALTGKEWTVGKQRKNILGGNLKCTYYDGRRDQPIDLEASIEEGREVWEEQQFYQSKLPDYFRIDVSVAYKINTSYQTHSLHLDVQNLTNRFNVSNRFYDPISQSLVLERQNGLIPFIVYRLQL